MKYFIDTEFLEGTQKNNFPLSIFKKETKPTIDLISVGIVSEDNREYYSISKDFNLKEAWNRCDIKLNKLYNPSMGNGKDSPYNPMYIKTYWIRENVLKPIYKELANFHINYYPNQKHIHFGTPVKDNRLLDFNYKTLKWLINTYGKTNKQIAEEIYEFCKPIDGNPILTHTQDCEKVNIGRQNTYQNLKTTVEYVNGRTKPEFYGYFADYDWVTICWTFGKMINLPKGFPMYCIDLKQELDNACSKINKDLADYIISSLEVNNNVTWNELKCIFKYDDNIKKHKDYPKQINEHNALSDAKWNYELYKFLNTL